MEISFTSMRKREYVKSGRYRGEDKYTQTKIQEKVNLSVIQVYILTFGLEVNEIEKLCKLLGVTLEKKKEYCNIMMGDCNSNVGQVSAIEGIKRPYMG